MFGQINWKKVIITITGCLFFFLIVTSMAVFAFFNKIEVTNSKGSSWSQTDLTSSPEFSKPANKIDKVNKRINILLLGLDDGDPDNPGAPRRSDTMIVASINPDNKAINLLSIPRDTKVSIPGRTGFDKINEAFFYGGPELSVRTVQEFIGVPVDYYIEINWQAFIKIVDILGGVDINVEHDMNYEDPYENLSIHLEKGYQHLDGEQAGEYVRFRHDELGDIGRVQRQQHFLKIMSSQMLQAGTILKLPSLMATLSHYIKTDMNSYTLLKVANMLKDMRASSFHTAMVPGDFATIDNLSYWIPNKPETEKLVNTFFNVE